MNGYTMSKQGALPCEPCSGQSDGSTTPGSRAARLASPGGRAYRICLVTSSSGHRRVIDTLFQSSVLESTGIL